MSETHITPDLLEAVARGELPPRLLVQVGWKHLIDLCPCCRRAVDAWQSARREPLADYDAALRVLPAVIDRHRREVGRAHRRRARPLRGSRAGLSQGAQGLPPPGHRL